MLSELHKLSWFDKSKNVVITNHENIFFTVYKILKENQFRKSTPEIWSITLLILLFEFISSFEIRLGPISFF